VLRSDGSGARTLDGAAAPSATADVQALPQRLAALNAALVGACDAGDWGRVAVLEEERFRLLQSLPVMPVEHLSELLRAALATTEYVKLRAQGALDAEREGLRRFHQNRRASGRYLNGASAL
jgi:hypothetical protein